LRHCHAGQNSTGAEASLSAQAPEAARPRTENASPADITDEQWERTFATNIFGYFYMARAALRHLKEGGVILNTGSITPASVFFASGADSSYITGEVLTAIRGQTLGA
jgi:NAD(P)-dependent dehydrogenase (short-subunit alcohol dehydrogenase family)